MGKLRKGGFADTSLEVLGNVAAFSDMLGLGYGEWARHRLGDAIYDDSYIKGLDEYTDAVTSFTHSVAPAAMNLALPGSGAAVTALQGVGNMFINDPYADKELYKGQHKIQNVASLGGGLASTATSFMGDLGTSSEIPGTNLSATEQQSLDKTLSPKPLAKGGSVTPKSSPMNLRSLGNPQVYKGQKHSEPKGGIPVDENGNPVSKSGKSTVAITEEGEVVWDGYVFSGSITL